MTDPFTPIEAEPPRIEGDIDVTRAILDALAAIARNAAWIVPALAALGALYVLSGITLVGWIVFFPWVSWVVYRSTLAMMDGRLTRVPGPGAPFGTVFVRGWGILLVEQLLLVPVYLVVVPILVAPMLGHGVPRAVEAGLFVPGMLWTFVTCRFALAPWLVVERDLPVAEAYALSWRSTARPRAKVLALQLVVTLLAAPATVISVVSTFQRETIYVEDVLAGRVSAWAAMGLDGPNLVVIAMDTALPVLSIVSYAAVYRQLFASEAPPA